MDFAEFLVSAGEAVTLDGGRHVFRQGDRDTAVYRLQRGLLKAYYVSESGKETIKSFVQPGELIGSLSAAFRKETCSFSLVCLESSVLVRIEFDELYAASQRDLQLARAMLDHLLEFAMKKERREREFLTESAEQRYRLLVRQAPELLGKVRQKDIARYLGITPVALSRIRKRGDTGR